MQTFGSILRGAGWIFTLGSVVLVAVLLLAFFGGARPTEAQFVQGVLAIIIAVGVLPAGLIALVAGYVIRWSSTDRKSRGRTTEVSAAISQDPLDPTYMLGNPPAGAQVMSERGRRVVVLADGSVIGELLTGRAQRFPSLAAYRDFVGA